MKLENNKWYGAKMLTGYIQIRRFIDEDEMDAMNAKSGVINITGILSAKTSDEALQQARKFFSYAG